MIQIACRKHPKYRARKHPKLGGCDACWRLYSIKEQILRLNFGNAELIIKSGGKNGGKK